MQENLYKDTGKRESMKNEIGTRSTNGEHMKDNYQSQGADLPQLINCTTTEDNIVKTKSDESGKFVTANDDEMNLDAFKGSIAMEDSREEKRRVQKLHLIRIEDAEMMSKDLLQGPLTGDPNDNMGFLDIIPTQHDLDNK